MPMNRILIYLLLLFLSLATNVNAIPTMSDSKSSQLTILEMYKELGKRGLHERYPSSYRFPDNFTMNDSSYEADRFVRELFSQQGVRLKKDFPATDYFVMTFFQMVKTTKLNGAFKNTGKTPSAKKKMDVRANVMKKYKSVVEHYFALDDQGKHVFKISQQIMFIFHACNELIKRHLIKDAHKCGCAVPTI